MDRWLYTTDTVRLAAADVEQRLPELRELLQRATGSSPEPPAGDGSFALDLPARALGRDLAKRVRVSAGVLRRDRHRTILPLRWWADPSTSLFPVFDGALEIEELAPRLAGLTLVGRTTAPFGPLGALFDAALLHGIAEETATRLLRSLTRVLESPPVALPEDPGVDVAEVMTPAPIVVTEDTPLRACARLLLDTRVAGLPVVDADGVLVGVLSEVDLLPRVAAERFGFGRRALREHDLRVARTAGEACSRPARCTTPDAPIDAAVRELLDHDVSRLVVLAGGDVVGIVTRHDVLRALVRDDASVTAEVRGLLDDLGAAELDVAVRDGRVVLTGAVDRRTLAEQLERLTADVPGVDEVDASALRWRTDDLVPLTPMPYT